ncbi:MULTISPECIES: hypothetical protein [unclassified Burkholderia]|uniref:hypothetical protein n=1 Tax=unclassified Burkholderia TaxID=2613784 RepID=UPI001423319E|nr:MULTISPECIES: hypothetical protein [unclassified Burkholderia]NIE85207.1 hypothetical protein [Burkholderia sp. Tr-860]NIF65049.1 hypothetical protein [Burkholderia sp. Cy-647]NIF73524.1 hypothetical protein [Burkholderia sp. Ap-962]NIF96207.1 hypothetical protein [Burkholderia sp. Ax-1720]
MRESDSSVDPSESRKDDRLLISRLFSAEALLRTEMRDSLAIFCETHQDVVLPHLPGVLEPLARACAFEEIFELVMRLGGRRVYLPIDVARFAQQTTVHIPADAYRCWRLHADVSGQIDVPSAWGVYLSIRRAALAYALSRSWSRDLLQSTFGLSRTQLRAYRGARPQEQH